MTILTEEMIIKAAIAIVDKRFDVINGRVPSEHEVGKLYARAALEAVLPDVVEKCAQAVERTIPYGLEPYNRVRRKSATAIRSLLNKEGDANG